jgi:hypothetical protein
MFSNSLVTSLWCSLITELHHQSVPLKGILGPLVCFWLSLSLSLCLSPGYHEVNRSSLPHIPARMYCAATGPKQWNQVTMDWNLGNHDPKQTFPTYKVGYPMDFNKTTGSRLTQESLWRRTPTDRRATPLERPPVILYGMYQLWTLP